MIAIFCAALSTEPNRKGKQFELDGRGKYYVNVERKGEHAGVRDSITTGIYRNEEHGGKV